MQVASSRIWTRVTLSISNWLITSTFFDSWSSSCSSRQWETPQDWGLAALRTPVEQPSRMKKCCYSQRNLGSICCSLFGLSHISNINPFAILSGIKCERYTFLKNCVRSFIIVDYVSACVCIRIVVSWLYNTST